jgi:hypothetical protein
MSVVPAYLSRSLSKASEDESYTMLVVRPGVVGKS